MLVVGDRIAHAFAQKPYGLTEVPRYKVQPVYLHHIVLIISPDDMNNEKKKKEK